MAQEVPALSRSRQPRAGLVLAGLLAAAGVAGLFMDSAGRRRAENRKIVADAARRLDLPPALLLAVAEVESGFDDRAVSERGARGMLQVLPETGREVAARLGVSADPSERRDHALVGGEYLRSLLERYRGDLHLALAAYHAGPGRVDAWTAKGDGLPGPELVGAFAFDETRRYVADVLAARRSFEDAACAVR